ncbi:hypothetical protein SK128_016641 [Halocaridina rubra]|uniref:Major facilitator superfamily (MFS) profile domain-containing protein n=1 Tax=Halocaridina rubra TaxID=373956 RepID=A0AAN8WLG2_HALRR
MTVENFEIEKLRKDAEKAEEDNVANKEPPAERRARLTKQVGLVCLVSLGYVCLGSTLTWPSPALSDMLTNNGTLVGTEINFNSLEKDMTGSLVYLGTLFGAWFAGWMVSAYGRHRSLQMTAIPYLLGWLMSALAPTTAVLLSGRFILGIAGGGTSIAGYAYVVELADVNIRGMMATLPTMGVVLGNLYTVTLGYFLQWHHLTLVCSIPTILFMVLTFILPESPSYLVITGQRQQALTILRKLRGDYANVDEEIAELERRNATGTDSKSGGWRGLLQKQVLKRISVVTALFFMMQLCGNFVLMIYTARILEATGAPLDPDAITAIAGSLRVAGTLAAIFLLDIIGRRYCLVISHAINACCLLILGTYVYLAENAGPDQEIYESLTWVPTVCVTVALFICDIGVHPVPYILSSEYFPTNIRSQASSVCISAGTVFSFLALQMYSPMQETLTQAGLYWLYAATSIIGVFFSFVAVTETKGMIVG